MLYAFWSPTLRRVKIGTTNDVERRKAELEREFGPLVLVKVLEGGIREETRLKRKFHAYRIPGTEFFHPCRELEHWVGTILVPAEPLVRENRTDTREPQAIPRRTRAEMQRDVDRLVMEYPTKTDRAIAYLAGVDHKTVAKRRRRKLGDLPHVEKREGRDGKFYHVLLTPMPVVHEDFLRGPRPALPDRKKEKTPSPPRIPH